MSPENQTNSPDLLRWTFTINPDHRTEIETYLLDLGADVLIREGSEFLVTWDEPSEDMAEVVEGIWSLNGAPFEVIQEEFQQLGLHTLHHSDDEPAHEAA
jgi:hypothetical protein